MTQFLLQRTSVLIQSKDAKKKLLKWPASLEIARYSGLSHRCPEVPGDCCGHKFLESMDEEELEFERWDFQSEILVNKEAPMFVVVEHTITNADAFFGLAPRVAEAPSGIKVLQFFPSVSKDRAVCLWEANSVDALKGFLEPLSAPSSRNTYYTVDSTNAIGLPVLGSAAGSAG